MARIQVQVLANGVQVQRETERGAERVFVPLEEIADCVVVEAFCGWRIVSVAQLVHRSSGKLTTIAEGSAQHVARVREEVVHGL